MIPPRLEMPTYDKATQDRFVQDQSRRTDQVRLVPELLFSATLPSTAVGIPDRIYHVPSSDGGFGFGVGALFDQTRNMPDMLIRSFGESNAWIVSIPRGAGNNKLNIRGQLGKTSFDATYYPHEGDEQSPLFNIGGDNGIPRGQEGSVEFWMPAWTEIANCSDADKLLAMGKVIYDREAGVFEGRMGDLVVRAKDNIPANALLERYFPQELRDDRFEAGVEHDVWASANWMADFGITLRRVTEVPVEPFN